MTKTNPRIEPPDYGLDAPAVVRNLFVVGVTGLSAWAVVRSLVSYGRVGVPTAVLGLSGMAFGTGLLCTAMGIWMIWEGKIGKMRARDRLLDLITWSGRERVLDVGCGRGLILIGVAKRLSTGIATGIDIWQSEDLTGNSLEATLENARREGVRDRVDVQTADMRKMPFPSESFDVVVSRAAIHNVYNAKDRAQVIREIARVLKPGGTALIDDIRHHGQYIAVFAQNGCTDVRRVGSIVAYLFATLLTFGSLRPATLVVTKSSLHR
jgi:ubiquinone/menaquinone biosynthesis C-methylase UbiE